MNNKKFWVQSLVFISYTKWLQEQKCRLIELQEVVGSILGISVIHWWLLEQKYKLFWPTRSSGFNPRNLCHTLTGFRKENLSLLNAWGSGFNPWYLCCTLNGGRNRIINSSTNKIFYVHCLIFMSYTKLLQEQKCKLFEQQDFLRSLSDIYVVHQIVERTEL